MEANRMSINSKQLAGGIARNESFRASEKIDELLGRDLVQLEPMAERMGASRQSFHAMKQAEMVFLQEETVRLSMKSGEKPPDIDNYSPETDRYSICHLYKW